MPAADLARLVHSAVEKNAGIPAMLDAYGQFIDSPIGPLELSQLESVFSAILENLRIRYPQIASQRASVAARNDIDSFLSATNNDPERVKIALKAELRSVVKTMSASISERFARMNPEERKAIDATLRLMRRSNVELMFRAEAGKPVSSSGSDFERFFAAVTSESPGMKELRYQNLIVEKAVFNKLLLVSKSQNYFVWVPSFYAKEDLDTLIEKSGVQPEHLLHFRLVEMKNQGRLDQFHKFLDTVVKSSGILAKGDNVPEEFSDFFKPVGERFVALAPIDLDDIYLLEQEEEEQERERERENQERKNKEEALRIESEKKVDQLKLKNIPMPVASTQSQRKEKEIGSVYLGKQMDFGQLASAITKRASENEINSNVKSIGDYYSDIDTLKSRGIVVMGASGSGKSVTLRRLLDGIGSITGSRVITLDQKGEHRGVAWKYNWKVYAFVGDSQAKQFRLSFMPEESNSEERAELLADMLQEWCFQSGVGCTDQQRARIASLIRAETAMTNESLAAALAKEVELEPVVKKLSKNFLASNVAMRIFSPKESDLDFEGNVLFDISGRGLRDPTTKEERLLVSILLLKVLETRRIQGAIIVVEDMLDRFKSENLRRKCVNLVSKLRGNGNSIVATARTQIREFLSPECPEIVHRLSGEKTIASEISSLKFVEPVRGLGEVIAMLPRGWALASASRDEKGRTTPSAAVRVEPVQFTTST
jgi:hypothetical protein